MFSHVMLGANDIEESKAFYDKTMVILGTKLGKLSMNHDGITRYVYYVNNQNSFMISEPINGEPVLPSNGSTIGFKGSSIEMIDQWHAAGIEFGMQTPELCKPPGIREGGGVQLYLAYLNDPSGNKLCTMLRL
tara:strand:+ start:1993 stop:2391 length:399 start_codon:yes stop_codon:yes gene_type:complete